MLIRTHLQMDLESVILISWADNLRGAGKTRPTIRESVADPYW